MKIDDKKRVLREMVLHRRFEERCYQAYICLLYTSDAADE